MRTFFPEKMKTEKVGASSHCSGAEYWVGIGNEIWPDGPARVLKIQMAYGGQVAGRKAPSFPILEEKREGYSYQICPDFDEVVAAAEKMINPVRRWLVTWDRPRNGADVGDLITDAIKQACTLNDGDLARPCLQVRTIEIQAAGTAAEVAQRICQELHGMGAPTGIRLYVARLADSEAVDV